MAAKVKRKILTAAQELMRSGGYHGTGTNAIIERAGISSGSFFYHFKSKPIILHEMIEEYVQNSLFDPFDAAFEKHSDPYEALLCFIDDIERWYAADGFQGGCMLGNMALELSDSQDEIRALIADKFQLWQKHLITRLEGVELAIPTRRFAALYVAAIEGVTMLCKAHKDKRQAKEEWQACRDLVALAFNNQKRGTK